MFLVMSRETGSLANDIDIILPFILASILALADVYLSQLGLQVLIFSLETETCLLSRPTLKPNYVVCCEGSS